MNSLGVEEKNEEIIKDCEVKISELFKDLKKLEVACFLSGENDHLDTYLEISIILKFCISKLLINQYLYSNAIYF